MAVFDTASYGWGSPTPVTVSSAVPQPTMERATLTLHPGASGTWSYTCEIWTTQTGSWNPYGAQGPALVIPFDDGGQGSAQGNRYRIIATQGTQHASITVELLSSDKLSPQLRVVEVLNGTADVTWTIAEPGIGAGPWQYRWYAWNPNHPPAGDWEVINGEITRHYTQAALTCGMSLNNVAATFRAACDSGWLYPYVPTAIYVDCP